MERNEAIGNSVAERVIHVLTAVSETDAVRRQPEMRLYELGVIDSLGTVELIVALSEEFEIDLSPAEIDRDLWATPANIVAFMEARLIS